MNRPLSNRALDRQGPRTHRRFEPGRKLALGAVCIDLDRGLVLPSGVMGTWLLLPLVLGAPDLRRTPVVEVVERVGAAVVNISATARATPFSGRRGMDAWERFFGRRPQPRSAPASLGSGVLIAASAFVSGAEGTLVLTNEHVIEGTEAVTVTLSDRRAFRAEVLGADPDFDVAVLLTTEPLGDTTSMQGLPSVPLGTSEDLMIGEPLVAIGNPFGLSNTVTTGVVSALHRVIKADGRVYEDFIQTDAAINPGNSGGALLSIEGKLVGINTAIYSEGTGIGFAIPVDKVRAVVQEVLRFGEVRPAYTGLIVAPGEGPGAEVRMVIPDSPAGRAGILPGDRIVDLGGQEVRDGRGFRQLERALVPGRARVLRVRRKQSTREFTLEVQELVSEVVAEVALQRLGLELKGARGGFEIVRVSKGSSAYVRGIRPGDYLLGLAGRRTRTSEALRSLLAAIYDLDQVTAIIGRKGRAYTVPVTLSVR